MDVLTGGSLIMGGVPDPLAVNRIDAKSGPLKIGAAASGHGLTATDDLLVAGKLEVDQPAYFDDKVVIKSAFNQLTLDSADHSVFAINAAGTSECSIYMQKATANKWRLGMVSGSNDLSILDDGTATIMKLVQAGDIEFYPSAMANKSEIGQGDTDTDISYIALRNASGALCYIYPDAAGTGIVVTTTKP